MSRYLLLSLLLLSAALSGAETGLSFEAENIDFCLRKALDPAEGLIWEASGTYSFSNSSGQAVKQVIAFPIPFGNGQGPQQNLQLEKLEGDPEARVELISTSDLGLSFGLDLPPRSFISLRISYRQRVSGNTASYILTTANTWAQALPSAIYSLYVENGIELCANPLPHPLTLSSKTGNYYFWEFRNFRPKQDFVLSLD